MSGTSKENSLVTPFTSSLMVILLLWRVRIELSFSQDTVIVRPEFLDELQLILKALPSMTTVST